MFENIDGARAELKTLVDERATVWARMQEIAFSDPKSAEDGVGAVGVRSEAYDKAEARLDEIDAEIGKLDRLIKRVATENERQAAALEQPAAGEARIVAQAGTEDQYRETFGKWLRDGMASLTPAERSLMEARQVLLPEIRALAAGTTTAGGFTVPEGFIAKITDAIAAFGGIRNAGVTKITTDSGADLPIPTANDTGNSGELLGENSAAAEQDVTFGQVVLKAFTWSSKQVRVSYALLQDTGVNIEDFLALKLGQRIGRAQAPYLITGTGSGQPEGIVTGTTVGETAANAATLVYSDFVDLEHSVDPAYRVNGEYVISDSALKFARLIVDTTGRPIWAPGMNGAMPNTINGFKYTVDQSMAAVATGTKPALFGDLSYYWMRDVKGVQLLRLTERYAEYLQVGFLAFSRMDGRQATAGDAPFKVMQMA